jgi:hypothetical protein
VGEYFDELDFHVIAAGIVFVPVLALCQATWAPSWAATPAFSAAVVFLGLNPMIITRAIDNRAKPASAIRYLIINELLAALIALLSAAICWALFAK